MPRTTMPARLPGKRRSSKQTSSLQRSSEPSSKAGSMTALQNSVTSSMVPLARADILASQNTAGNKAVQRLLAGRTAAKSGSKHRGEQVSAISSPATPAIQRTPMTADDIIGSLDRIDFINKKLAMKLHGVHTNDANDMKRADLAKRAGKEKSMRQRVEATLKAYEEAFQGGHRESTANAMMMAMAIQGADRVIAEELYDPGLTPKLAKR